MEDLYCCMVIVLDCKDIQATAVLCRVQEVLHVFSKQHTWVNLSALKLLWFRKYVTFFSTVGSCEE